MEQGGIVKLLLVEDDEDDYILTREVVAEIPGKRYILDWARSFEAGLNLMVQNLHDVVLVDYRLGAHNGVELLRMALDNCGQAPVILLTGAGEHQVDLEAMQAGAADYLIKSQLRADTLERSVRYALQRRRAAALASFEQARLAAFGAKIGLALTRRDSLEGILEQCAAAMAQFLNAALAQIAIYDARNGEFGLQTAAGALQNPECQPQGPPVLPIDLLLKGQPLLLKHLLGDGRMADQTWVKREAIGSYAAYPLVLEDKLLGLMSIYTQHPLTEHIWQEMASVANGISLCIQRKLSEQALDASEDKYRSVVESIKEVIFQLDEVGQWAFLNPAWTAITGFEVKPTLDTFFLDYIHPDEREQSRHIFLQLIERRLEYCRYETRFLTKGGQTRWVEIYAQPTPGSDGSIEGASGSLTDVTERKLAEEAIQKLAAFPQVNPNPVLEFAADGTLTYANDAARNLATTLGKADLWSILPNESGAIVRECLAQGQKKLHQKLQVDKRTLTWSFFPVVTSHVVHCYGSDATEMLSLEAQLRHAQKLESVGQLAAGVAHDFNNILTVIQGYSEMLLARCQDDLVMAPALKQVSDAAHRAAGLTRQLLAFSRKQVIQLRALDLNSLLQNLAKMLLRLLREDIMLETVYAEGLPRIEADAGMIEQIVMNLAVNARDAMPQGGKLAVVTTALEIGNDYARAHPEARMGRFVCLAVTDTGCGMDAKTLERIFEPFFSTKEVGKGTGLGLATVYGIVKQHHGWIEVNSQLGAGTAFRIYFPAARQPAEAAGRPATQDGGPLRGGEETILVVEDELIVREFVRDILREHRYRVFEAQSGGEALRVWDEAEGQIDLLLTDMVMPEGMNGRELAHQLRQRKPGLKVVFSSGYSPETLDEDLGRAGVSFLPKPYLPPELVKTVRQALDVT